MVQGISAGRRRLRLSQSVLWSSVAVALAGALQERAKFASRRVGIVLTLPVLLVTLAALALRLSVA